MCTSPLLHKNLPLSLRCEISLAGFLSLDMFKILADETCQSFGSPTGSCFMAPQTVYNLQGVALATVVITVTKDAEWQPWRHGECRLAELPIEEFFSFLRRQSSNSQLSARGYFQASARTAMKHGKLLNALKPADFKGGEPPLEDAVLLVRMNVESCIL